MWLAMLSTRTDHGLCLQAGRELQELARSLSLMVPSAKLLCFCT